MIYAIRCEATGLVKIGHAKDPEKRLADLQCGSAPTLTLVATAPGAEAMERRIHSYLADRRVHGEWFVLSESEAAEAVTAGGALNARYTTGLSCWEAARFSAWAEYWREKAAGATEVQCVGAAIGIALDERSADCPCFASENAA